MCFQSGGIIDVYIHIQLLLFQYILYCLISRILTHLDMLLFSFLLHKSEHGFAFRKVFIGKTPKWTLVRHWSLWFRGFISQCTVGLGTFLNIISNHDILNSSVGSNFLNTQSTYILYPWTSDVDYFINQILLIASCSYGENSEFQMKVIASAEINIGFIYSSVRLSTHASFSFCYSWHIH